MKPCKSCCAEIDETASKCRYCQTHQYWYKNPKVYANGVFIPLLVLMWFQLGIFFPDNYEDYKNDLSVKFVNERIQRQGGYYTYEIHNDTDVKWSRITYQLIGKDDNGDIVRVENGSDYSWIVQPHDTSLITATVKHVGDNIRWSLTVKELKAERW
jgi:hypothetical protein